MMLVSPSAAPEDALEWFFDHYIANETEPKTEKEKEELKEKEIEDFVTNEKIPRDKENKKEDYSSQNAPVPAAESDPVPVLTNVISTVYLGCRLDLDYIAHKSRNVEYKPDVFRHLRMRLRSPQVTAVICQSGNLMCCGAMSIEDSRTAARRIARLLQNLGFPVCFINFEIQNLSAVCQLFPVCLERLYVADPLYCSFEPELFQALFYYLPQNVTATVFSTGSVIFTGAKRLSDIHEAFQSLYPKLCCVRTHCS